MDARLADASFRKGSRSTHCFSCTEPEGPRSRFVWKQMQDAFASFKLSLVAIAWPNSFLVQVRPSSLWRAAGGTDQSSGANARKQTSARTSTGGSRVRGIAEVGDR